MKRPTLRGVFKVLFHIHVAFVLLVIVLRRNSSGGLAAMTRVKAMNAVCPLPTAAMARNAFVLAAILSTCAQAQTTYRCTPADGRPYLRDSPCPAGNKQERISTLSAADRRTIARNMGATEQAILEFEAQCVKGFKQSCDVLNTYKTKTGSQVRAEDLSRARQACAAGEKASCDALNFGAELERRQREGASQARSELIKRYSAQCDAGDPRACKKLSNLR